MRLLVSCLLLAGLPSVLSALDITGKWSGTVELKTPNGETNSDPAYAEFHLKGDEVTGSAGNPESPVPIENGRLAGDKLTFQLTFSGDSGQRVFKVSLIVVDKNKITGEVTGTTGDGQKTTGKVTLSRQSG